MKKFQIFGLVVAIIACVVSMYVLGYQEGRYAALKICIMTTR